MLSFDEKIRTKPEHEIGQMGFIKIRLWRRPTVARQLKTQNRHRGSTPIRYVRRKFLLQGEEYAVALKRDAPRNGLAIEGQTMVVSLCPATRENFDRFMRDWYRRRARRVFQASVERWLPRFATAGHEITPPRLKIFAMRRAWGRCYYTKGLITLNLHLVKAPQRCIDYIVLHELCHFVVSNHSKDFHRLVESFLPDWRAADELLKTFARARRVIG